MNTVLTLQALFHPLFAVVTLILTILIAVNMTAARPATARQTFWNGTLSGLWIGCALVKTVMFLA